MSRPILETSSRTQHGRHGLAPVELVLWMPVMLMVMALIVNYANMTSWRLRGEAVARDAVWRSRWPRSGNAEPRPSQRIWPSDAGMGVHNDDPIWDLNHPNINHPVVRGPILELGEPPHSFDVLPILDQGVGARKGVSDIQRRYDLFPALGQYRSGEIADRMLTNHWQNAQMNFGRHARRSLKLYKYPETPPSLPNAYTRSIIDLWGIPHYYALSVLNEDEDWRIFKGGYPNFYHTGQVQIAVYPERDPEVVYERSVKPLIDRLGPRNEVIFGHISELPRFMTDEYLDMYELAKGEIEQKERRLISSPPLTPERRLQIEQRLAQLYQIQDLELKIKLLKQDQETLDQREQKMKDYVRPILLGAAGG